MDKPTSRRGREPITAGRADSPRAVVLFHGYTASSGDFNDLPERIARELDAYVYVPLLPGHGTRVEDLLPLDFETFLNAAEEAVARIERPGRQLAIGGHSFGAYLAVLCSRQHEPSALFTTVIPYRLRFPYSSFIGRTISRTKPLWKKHLTPEEWEARGMLSYREMPGKALSLVAEGKRRIEKLRGAIECPTLAIHAENDQLAYPQESIADLALIGKKTQEDLILENGRHSIYFSPKDQERVASTIIDFLDRSFTAHE